MKKTGDKYKLTDNQIITKPSFFWNNSVIHEATDIKDIRIETVQNFASDAIIEKKDNSYFRLKIRWRNQVKDLTDFAIRNQIKCTIEEACDGDIQIIYPS